MISISVQLLLSVLLVVCNTACALNPNTPGNIQWIYNFWTPITAFANTQCSGLFVSQGQQTQLQCQSNCQNSLYMQWSNSYCGCGNSNPSTNTGSCGSSVGMTIFLKNGITGYGTVWTQSYNNLDCSQASFSNEINNPAQTQLGCQDVCIAQSPPADNFYQYNTATHGCRCSIAYNWRNCEYSANNQIWSVTYLVGQMMSSTVGFVTQSNSGSPCTPASNVDCTLLIVVPVGTGASTSVALIDPSTGYTPHINLVYQSYNTYTLQNALSQVVGTCYGGDHIQLTIQANGNYYTYLNALLVDTQQSYEPQGSFIAQITYTGTGWGPIVNWTDIYVNPDSGSETILTPSPTTPAPTTIPPPSSSSSSLSTSALIGIVVGSIAGIIVLCVLLCILVRRCSAVDNYDTSNLEMHRLNQYPQ